MKIMSCDGCGGKQTRNEKFHHAIRDVYTIAKKNGWKEAAILERANKTGYIICESKDERCNRLRVMGYYSVDG